MAWHRFLLLLVNIIGHYPIYCVAELTGKFPLGGHDIIQMDKHNETITVAMCLETFKGVCSQSDSYVPGEYEMQSSARS